MSPFRKIFLAALIGGAFGCCYLLLALGLGDVSAKTYAIHNPWLRMTARVLINLIVFSPLILWVNYKKNSKIVWDRQLAVAAVQLVFLAVIGAAFQTFNSLEPYFLPTVIIGLAAAFIYQVHRKVMSPENGLVWGAIAIVGYFIYRYTAK